MNSPVPVMEKRDFLKWFLEEHQLKRRECTWLLNFLMSDDYLMERVHFVDDAEFCPKSIIISANDMESVPFAFHKKKHVTMDAEKSFHDIRLNREEDIYIQLNFKDKHLSPQYVAVLEENPFNQSEETMPNIYSLLAEASLDEALLRFQLNDLEKKIDQALDNKDKASFEKLAKEFKELKNKE